MNDGWTDDADECAWYGLVCDTSGSVIAIELSHNNLRGVLEVEFALLSKIGTCVSFNCEIYYVANQECLMSAYQ